MRNVLLFIRRYQTFILFLFLQVVSLWFLFYYNRFHRVQFLGAAQEITGRINAQYNRLEDFFALREENLRVHAYNDSLLNLLEAQYADRDRSLQVATDSLATDSSGRYRRYYYRAAQVVYNTVNFQKNYLQLNRGFRQGIRDNMAVVSSDGAAIGIVVNVSPNFCQVMSLLHIQNAVSAALKRSGDYGMAIWDGKDPRYLLLRKIPKSLEVRVGDTVLTSPVSFNFPPGHLLGTVAAIRLDNTTGMYELTIRTAASFTRLQQVHVIENRDYAEQSKLNEETKREMENQPKTPR